MKKDNSNIETFLSLEEKKAIEKCVTEVELRTAAEIKVLVVESSRSFGLPRVSMADKRKDVLRRAKKEYDLLGIGNTRDDTGVLIMLSLKERIVQVLPGGAINEKIADDIWPKMVNSIILGVLDGHPEDGICSAVKSIGDMLAEHFPVKESDTDEICNSVVLKK